MATITTFDSKEKAIHNSHKFSFLLKPDNYGHWKILVQPFLVTNDLFGYVDGTIPCPETTILASSSAKDKEPSTETRQPNPEYSAWVANDAHVRMLILSTVSESAIQHAQGTTTSREVWLALERAFSPHTSSREYTLKTQLLRIEMKPDESSFAYLTRAQEYSTALANIGEPMKEKDLVMLIISGLRPEYNGLKTAALTKQLALNELHALFADHDYMHQKYNSHVTPPTQAFATTLKTAAPVTPNLQPAQPSDAAVQAVQQLAAQLGLQLQTLHSPKLSIPIGTATAATTGLTATEAEEQELLISKTTVTTEVIEISSVGQLIKTRFTAPVTGVALDTFHPSAQTVIQQPFGRDNHHQPTTLITGHKHRPLGS